MKPLMIIGLILLVSGMVVVSKALTDWSLRMQDRQFAELRKDRGEERP